MRSPLVAWITLAAFVLLFVPPRGAAGADDTALARQHFEAGRTAYLAGDYATAAREFQTAQAIRPSPILDYNLGLSFEGLGDPASALGAYQRYLEAKPDAPNRAEVEQRMQALQQGAQPPQPPATEPGPPPGTDPDDQGFLSRPPPPAPVAVAPPPPKKRYWWIVFPIVGGVALTALVIWAVASSSYETQVYATRGLSVGSPGSASAPPSGLQLRF